MKRRKRSKLEIIIEILKSALEGSNKTKIVYGTNLNFKVAERYISELKALGLLEVEHKDGKKVYVTTEAGREFLKKFEKLGEL